MKKILRKIIAITLCITVIGSFSATAASAAFDPDVSVNEEVNPIVKALYNAVDVVIDKLVGAINSFLPTPASWLTETKLEGFMAGNDTFIDEAEEGNKWSIGYANASILTGDEKDGKHFVGGSLSVTDKTVSEIYDDLKVRVIVMDDNSGRGKVVFAVIDSYGMASSQVSAIRTMLSDYCKANNIISLNIAALHQHSAVDTFGMNGSILKALINPYRSAPVNGINEEYMKNLRNVLADTLDAAIKDMKEGTLYYGTADFSDYITDKRDPQVLVTDFDRFRFVPDDNSKETWFTTSAIHCVGNGAGGTDITGDYPYYAEKYINETYNANFILILGAEQGTTQDKDSVYVENDTRTSAEILNEYGIILAEKYASINNEVEVEPILNIKHEQVSYKITNRILVFAGKMGLFSNTVITKDGNFEVLTEIGYMEIGKDIAVALCPGEAAAELFYGGCLSADKSWTGKSWDLAPVKDSVGDKTLIVFGIINDQIGYIIPDNDYMALLEPSNKSLELVSTGNVTASAMVNDFAELIASVS